MSCDVLLRDSVEEGRQRFQSGRSWLDRLICFSDFWNRIWRNYALTDVVLCCGFCATVTARSHGDFQIVIISKRLLVSYRVIFCMTTVDLMGSWEWTFLIRRNALVLQWSKCTVHIYSIQSYRSNHLTPAGVTQADWDSHSKVRVGRLTDHSWELQNIVGIGQEWSCSVECFPVRSIPRVFFR